MPTNVYGVLSLIVWSLIIIWLLVPGELALVEIMLAPQFRADAHPWYGLGFFIHRGRAAFVLLGAVVRAVTGAEALYAEMGHFRKQQSEEQTSKLHPHH